MLAGIRHAPIQLWSQGGAWFQDEQLRRFKARVAPFRSYKRIGKDERNCAKWDRYYEAVEEMLEKTSTTWAPWTVVEANGKYYARVTVVQTLTKALKTAR
ncbi:MAG: hypothetical protein EPO61_11105 [Nitrospirae bacterium]|nr:MAG: hypothetical protein EPO61_11105 [Nitrospirota bacterium]